MIAFPLLLIPLAVYNIVAWLMPGVPLTDPLIRLMLVSGVEWRITLSDILLALGVLLLLLEIVKGARPGSKYLTDHLLSLIVFGGSAAEFVMLQKFGTSTFFLLSLMAMVDFFGGIALSARRPAAVSASRRGRREVEAPVREPQVEPANPAPAPSASPAAGVADSVLQDHPTPKATANAGEPSPTIPSPELQPGAGQSASPDAPPR
ncbi:MAG TPA: hypothetical protein VKR55_13645 [Bradyrhizobium sp.]|uniref:hypothetical protein n=1 Tax=Bradyrhizobium sp. TaxID=376 RepID=UPI002CA76739|nr:hypothetical protein [Bradyrhizobium sp.]HLZ03177.1 hypothetical protein [Bradyrhizobium sp.]